jgi:putative ABC transport system permease protein
MRLPLGLVFAHARKNWFRSLLTLGSVFVAMLTFGTLRTLVSSLEITVQGVSSQRVITESAVSLFINLPKKIERDIATVEGVAVAPYGPEKVDRPVVASLTWFGGEFISPKYFFARFAVEPEALRRCYEPDIVMPDEQWKAFEATRTGCIIGKDLAAQFDFKIGDVVPLKGNLFPGDYRLEVVGVYTSNNPSYDQSTMYFQWSYLNEVSKANAGPTEKTSVISTLLRSPEDAARISAEIDAKFENSSNRTRTLTERAFQASFLSMWGGLPTFFDFLGAVALAATFVVTLNTMLLNSRERIREAGVLKTLGFGDGVVTTLLLAESLFICLLGGSLTLPLLGLMHRSVVPGINMPLYVPGGLYVAVGALSAALGLCAGIFPALTSGRLKIVDALRRRG